MNSSQNKNSIYEQLPSQIRDKIISVGYDIKKSGCIDKEVVLSEVLETIQADNSLKDKINHLRKIKDEGKQQEYKRNKLPYFVTGQFVNCRRRNASLKGTSYAVFDFDHLGSDKEEKKEELKRNPNILSVFNSPRDGVKVICYFDKEITSHTEYSTLYKHYAKMLKADLGLDPDKTSDVARACFFSYDPELYINPNAKPLSSDIPSYQNPSDQKSSAKREGSLIAVKGSETGSRNSNLVRVAGLLIDRGFDLEFINELALAWNNSNKPPLSNDEVERTVESLYNRIIENQAELPVHYFIKNRSYYKKVKSGRENGKDILADQMVTSFIIEPKELLVLEDGDCLKCNIISNKGIKYEDVLIENTDWYSKAKLLKAIGHSECNFFGSEQEIQPFCNYINSTLRNRKEGTRIIGLIDSTWVIKGMNITKAGITKDISIVPVEKGADSFHNKISYGELDNKSYEELIKGFYSDILNINQPQTILPWLAWHFASPLRSLIMDEIGGFPLLFAHGTQGGGKTSTARMSMRLCGYTDPNPKSCTMKPFPMLKILSSTNGIPVVLDEFKKSDMSEAEIDHMQRIMRKIYSQETESVEGHENLPLKTKKGHPNSASQGH